MPTEQIKADLKTTNGINHRSVLCDLDGFEITTQLPPDIMHSLLEGIVQYELRHILSFGILAQGSQQFATSVMDTVKQQTDKIP